MMAGKANLEKLNALHGLLADYYADVLNSDEDLAPGVLAAINAFLKNNDINADIVEMGGDKGLGFKLRELIKDKEEV